MASSLDSPPGVHAPSRDGSLCVGRTLFGRYRLERLLGRGGMGVVWSARDTRLERTVALKFLSEICFLDVAARDDLKRETRRSLDLTHPHIVRIHDFVEDEETAAISMEYVDGPTLSHLRVERDNRCFDCDDLRGWVAQLCWALQYAHGTASCVHRDIKPSNLMVTARGALKVADFGIACGLQNTAARVSAWSSTGGTLGYMSPQQLRGELASPSDDLYSLGATLYELLTSKPPFHSGDLSLQIRDRRPELLVQQRAHLGINGRPIDPLWEETIAALLAKAPEDRPRDAREVAQRLGLEPTASPVVLESAETLPPTIVQRREAPPASQLSPAPSAPVVALPVAPAAALSRWFGQAEDWFRAHPQTVVIALVMLIFAGWLHTSRPVVIAPTVAGPAAIAEPSVPVVAPSVTATPLVAVSVPSAPVGSEPSRSQPPAETRPLPPATESFSPSPIALPPAPALAPTAAPTAESDPRPPAGPALLEVVTIPAGIPFRIVKPDYAAPDAAAGNSRGTTPALIEGLPAGDYRVVFDVPGLGERASTVSLKPADLTRCEQIFPSGTLAVASQPEGVEIFCDGVSVGLTPLTLSLLPGAHAIDARRGEWNARTRNVTVETNKSERLTFDFRAGSTSSSKGRSSRKTKPDDTALEKIGRSITKFFGAEKSGKK